MKDEFLGKTKAKVRIVTASQTDESSGFLFVCFKKEEFQILLSLVTNEAVGRAVPVL